MTDQDKKTVSQTDGHNNEQAGLASASRRKIIAGTASVPIISALASRPVLGAQNCVPSGFMSANLSRPDAYGSCGGLSPGYWKQSQKMSSWPAPYLPGITSQTYNVNANDITDQNYIGNNYTLFVDVFGIDDYPGRSLMDVLRTEEGSVAFHAIAALLNAASGQYLDPRLTVGIVIDIYQQYSYTGHYNAGGLIMDADTIRNFFVNTYH